MVNWTLTRNAETCFWEHARLAFSIPQNTEVSFRFCGSRQRSPWSFYLWEQPFKIWGGGGKRTVQEGIYCQLPLQCCLLLHNPALWQSHQCRRCCSCGEAEQCPQTIGVSGCASSQHQLPLFTASPLHKGSFCREDTKVIFSGSLTQPQKGAVVSHASWKDLASNCTLMYRWMCQWDLIPAEHIPATSLNL